MNMGKESERVQELEIILESNGRRVIKISALTGVDINDGLLVMPLVTPSVEPITEAKELLGSAIDFYRDRFNSIYSKLIRVGETLFPNNYSIRTEIKPYQR